MASNLPSVEIRQIDYSRVSRYAIDMKRSGVVTDDSPSTVWIGAFVQGDLAGVTALTLSKNTARIRSSYVAPQYRGHGIYQKMVMYAEGLSVHHKKKKITAFFNRRTVPYAYANGYTVSAANKNGVHFAEKVIEE